MATFDPATNTGNPTAMGRGAAFGPNQAPGAMRPMGPMNPGQPPAPGTPGSPPGSVASGAFPAGTVPPQLANILMGMNPNMPQMPNPVPGGMQGSMPGHAGGMGGGAFSSGFGPGQGMPQGMPPQAPGGPMTPPQGAFGRMGAQATGTPSWAGPRGR